MALPAQAALEQAPALLQQIDAALAAASAEGLRIDASALSAFDTSTVALLLRAQRRARARCHYRVTGASASCASWRRLYGVEELLPLAPRNGAGAGSS